MDFNSTIDLIIKDLNEASEIIDDLKKYPGVPALQVELAKSKCRSAGDVIALLKSISVPVHETNEPIYEKQQFQTPFEDNEPAKPVIVTLRTEEKKKESKTIGIPSPHVEKKPENKGPINKPAETQMVADIFTPTSDLYEEQSGNIKAEKDLSDQLKAKPINSLSEAIDISDKFLFMGEIFDGNKDAYAQAISRLDKAESLDDAEAIIKSYTGENTENEAVIQLLDLVKLKLTPNE
jgi:hypothetical protein